MDPLHALRLLCKQTRLGVFCNLGACLHFYIGHVSAQNLSIVNCQKSRLKKIAQRWYFLAAKASNSFILKCCSGYFQIYLPSANIISFIFYITFYITLGDSYILRDKSVSSLSFAVRLTPLYTALKKKKLSKKLSTAWDSLYLDQ